VYRAALSVTTHGAPRGGARAAPSGARTPRGRSTAARRASIRTPCIHIPGPALPSENTAQPTRWRKEALAQGGLDLLHRSVLKMDSAESTRSVATTPAWNTTPANPL